MFDASSAAGTDSQLHTCASARTLSHTGTRGLVFPAPVTSNEEEKVSRGQEDCVCASVCEFLKFSLSRRASWKLINDDFKSHDSPVSLEPVTCRPKSSMF